MMAADRFGAGHGRGRIGRIGTITRRVGSRGSGLRQMRGLVVPPRKDVGQRRLLLLMVVVLVVRGGRSRVRIGLRIGSGWQRRGGRRGP